MTNNEQASLGNIMEIEEIISEFEDLNSDYDRWQWFIKNHDEYDLSICLDNDTTAIQMTDRPDVETFKFVDYIGNSLGVMDLLEALGFEYEVS